MFKIQQIGYLDSARRAVRAVPTPLHVRAREAKGKTFASPPVKLCRACSAYTEGEAKGKTFARCALWATPLRHVHERAKVKYVHVIRDARATPLLHRR